LILGHVRKANPPREDSRKHTSVSPHLLRTRMDFRAQRDHPRHDRRSAAWASRRFARSSGVTDSEHAFCVVLDHIAAAFSSSETRGRP
jgi:hypothetical protein